MDSILSPPQPIEETQPDLPKPLSLEAEQQRREADVVEFPEGSGQYVTTAAARRLQHRYDFIESARTERRLRRHYRIGTPTLTHEPRRWATHPETVPLIRP